jgi:hypothetical protein
MNTCHILTTGPLVLSAVGFLISVLYLDAYRVRFSQQLSTTGSADALHLWLKIFFVLGVIAAAAALVLTSSCAAHSF